MTFDNLCVFKNLKNKTESKTLKTIWLASPAQASGVKLSTNPLSVATIAESKGFVRNIVGTRANAESTIKIFVEVLMRLV